VSSQPYNVVKYISYVPNIQLEGIEYEEEKLKKINVTDNDAKIMKHKGGNKKPSYNG